MKKVIIVFISVILLTLLIAFPAYAKPADNMAGAVKVAWNLSAAVMPVPPYGSQDIPGSDTASKLIVNQPNGKVEVAMTGAMKGLNADTTYTVYLSKCYEPYVDTGWDIEGDW
ncbi:MAG: hypothetical protein JW967_07075 [Dehalococcoidales bacterium]|nr:hypothetical protein [Dehalococcoidales bacterium]